MKIIILKDCKDGKANQIIDVKPGYAKNFLLKNSIAEPLNKKTQKNLNKRLKVIEQNNDHERQNSLKLKAKIEKIELNYLLEAHLNHIHHSITSKKVIQDLLKHDIEITKYMLSMSQINELGKKTIQIKLPQKIIAKLAINVKKGSP